MQPSFFFYGLDFGPRLSQIVGENKMAPPTGVENKKKKQTG